MYNIRFDQPGSNFPQLSIIKKQASSQNLKSITQKTKNRGTILFPEGLENTPLQYKSQKNMCKILETTLCFYSRP